MNTLPILQKCIAYKSKNSLSNNKRYILYPNIMECARLIKWAWYASISFHKPHKVTFQFWRLLWNISKQMEWIIMIQVFLRLVMIYQTFFALTDSLHLSDFHYCLYIFCMLHYSLFNFLYASTRFQTTGHLKCIRACHNSIIHPINSEW